MKISIIDEEGRQQTLSASSIRVYTDGDNLFMAAMEHSSDILFFGHILDEDWERLLKALGLDRVDAPQVKKISTEKPKGK